MRNVFLLLLVSCAIPDDNNFQNKNLGLNGTYSYRYETIVISNSMFFYSSPGCKLESELLLKSTNNYQISSKKSDGCHWIPKTMGCSMKLRGSKLDVVCPSAGLNALYDNI